MKNITNMPNYSKNNDKKLMLEREQALQNEPLIIKNNISIYDENIQNIVYDMTLRKLLLDTSSFESFAYKHMACFIRGIARDDPYSVLRRKFDKGGT